MRIYLPATATELADPDGLTARPAHAVTPALRAASPGESEEDLEVPAFLDAADAGLLRLAADDRPVRVVVAADVDAAEPTGEGLTEVAAPAVRWQAVVSFHVDDPDDAAVAALVRAAVGGDEAAVDAVGEEDLLWFDVSERAALCRLLGVAG